METVDPRSLPRAIHVLPRRGQWRIVWSDGKRALRRFPLEQQAIAFAKQQASGRFSVIIHRPDGYADVKRSILVKSTRSPVGVR